MGPQSYMRSVVDRNVVMRSILVILGSCEYGDGFSGPITARTLHLREHSVAWRRINYSKTRVYSHRWMLWIAANCWWGKHARFVVGHLLFFSLTLPFEYTTFRGMLIKQDMKRDSAFAERTL